MELESLPGNQSLWVISPFLGYYWKRECENLLNWNFAPVPELLFCKTKNYKYGKNMVKVVSLTLSSALDIFHLS